MNAEGEKYLDFVVRKVSPIAELNCTLRELEHLPSGALVMHIESEDPENLFCLSFKTYPSSSNGVAHILEHTVLCGSKKFPIKDPFFAMSRRSLNTFMNALTGADFTCYPAATQNVKDFYNLLDVYIDAVFHPELKKMSFLQEGHRLEFTSPSDPTSPLEIKGIVFNEMKGAGASLESRLWHTLMEDLLPDLPYAYNSGGDPKVIPQLSYGDLRSFHATYYHPSRCLFFFYGNFPLKTHLDTLSQGILKGIKKQPPLPPLKLQRRFTSPVMREITYPSSESGELGKLSTLVFGFLTAPLIAQEEVLALSILDAILMDNDASILRAKLLDSKLCIHVDAHMDTEMSEVPYALVFKGCDPTQTDAIEKTLRRSLAEIIEEGIPDADIESAVHQLELAKLEIAADHAPFGLTLFMRSALGKQHGGSAEHALKIYSLFEELLLKLKSPSYLADLIRRHFLNNPHYVRLTLNPDPELCEKEEAQEKETLEQLKRKLSPAEIQQILQETQELATFQQETEHQSIDCLPKVTLADVTPTILHIPLTPHRDQNLTIYHHPCFTNHITYADLLFDLPHLNVSELCHLQLLLSLIPELGCGKRSYKENLSYIQSYIGEISLSCGIYTQIQDPSKTRPALHIKGKALDRNAHILLTLMHEMLTSPALNDPSRIEELLKKLRDQHVNHLNRRAMRYASHLALSSFSQASYLHECWGGLTYFKAIKTITDNLTANLPSLIEALIALHAKLFTFHNPHLVLGSSSELHTQLSTVGYYGLNALTPTHPAHPAHPAHFNYPLPTPLSQGRPIPSQVAFTIEAFRASSYLSPHAPALTVATALLEHLILHRQIREKGGAYSSGAVYNATQGTFYFHAYRDPHLTSTLHTFHHAIDTIAQGHFTPQDLEEAKLILIQQLDTPIAPSGRAMIAYNWLREGKTEEMRQHFRTSLLSLNSRAIQDAVSTELLANKEKGIIVTLAGKDLLNKEGKKLPQLKILPLIE